VHVLDDPLLIALPYSHPLAARTAISLADLRDDEWMVCGVGGTCIDSNVVLRACDAAGFEPRITFETEDYSAIMGMVASGMGVALIPSLALVSAREDIAIRPLRDARPVRRVRAAFAVDRPSALADALLESCAGPGASARGRDGSSPSPPPDAQAASGSSSSPARRRRTARCGGRGRRAARLHAQQLDDRRGVLERVGDHARRCRSRWRRAGGRRPRRRRARRWGCAPNPGGEALERRKVGRGGVADGHRRQRDVAPRDSLRRAEAVLDARPGQ
jgi:hypothetical protein